MNMQSTKTDQAAQINNLNGNGMKEFKNMLSEHQDQVARDFRKKAEELQSKLTEAIEGDFSDLITQCVEELKKPDGAVRRHENAYDENGCKIFVPRESVLSELLEVNHIKTIYNIFAALLILYSVNTLVYDYHEYGRIKFDFGIITWAFGKFNVVVYTWLKMIVYSFTIFPLLQAWTINSQSWFPLPNLLWLAGYGLYTCNFLYFPVMEVVKHNLPPASAIILIAEQVRLLMKIYSFVRENAPKVLKLQKSQQADGVQELKEEKLPGFSQFLYFMFAPTLLYRDSYPMTQSIRWNFVVSNAVQVIVCIFYTYYIFVRFCVPVFRNTGKDTGSLRYLFLASFNSMLPGTLVLMLGFFAILHSWLNAFAEMLRFADRMFYRDWWNSYSYSSWYRMWNVVVHDWLYTYVYKDYVDFFGQKWRAVGVVVVFFLSAIAHEYILVIAFGFFFPALFVLFGGVGLCFIFLKPRKGNKNPMQSWNIFMWASLIFGNGLLMSLYSQEWFASINCPRKSASLIDVLIPRSWIAPCVT